MKLLARCLRFLVDEAGPTAVEYAMLTMLVLLAVLAAVGRVGLSAEESLGNSSHSIERAFSDRP